MKSQLDLQELAYQLTHQKKKDVIVDTSNIKFDAKRDGGFHCDNTLYLAEIDEAFKVNDVALIR